MDCIFFKELELPAPNYNLGVGSGLHNNQTDNILIEMEPILLQEKPDVVLVQVDTNIVFVGALAHPNLKVSNLLLNART
jgi:UDP-N-acetylglucosamine 2-epimerase (non-hydrolysing)